MPGVRCQTPGCSGFYNDTIEARPRADNSIRRRRQCLVCGGRATTYERIAPEECPKRAAELEAIEAESQLRDIQQMWPYLSPENRKAIHAIASLLGSGLVEVS